MSPQDKLEQIFNRIEIEPNTGCWLWTGPYDKNGYGKMGYNYAHWRTHRLVFSLVNNITLDKNKLVCHRCDTPSCINPDHLFLGSWKTNMEDKVSKGRLRNQNMEKTHCVHGHEFTAENTILDKTRIGNIKRTCKICYTSRFHKANAKKYLQRRKQ